MKIANAMRTLAVCLLAAGTMAGCSKEPATPEAKRAKAEALLKTMSASLSNAKAIEVHTSEVSDRVRRNGKVDAEAATRQIAVRRPNGAYFRVTNTTRDTEVWYDGAKVTVVMHKDKAWARGPMPPTLDEALDFMATEYDITMAAADLFYSNPYDAVDWANNTGGWVGTETIDGTACHHLAFEGKLLNWSIWVADTAQALPCRMKLTYKEETGSPSTVLTFSKWNLNPSFTDQTFEAKVDPAFERLYMVRAPTAEPDPAATDTPAAPAAPAPQQ